MVKCEVLLLLCLISLYEHFKYGQCVFSYSKVKEAGEVGDDAASTPRSVSPRVASNPLVRDESLLQVKKLNYLMTPYNLANELRAIASRNTHLEMTQEVIGRTASYNDIILLKISDKRPAMRTNEDKYVEEAPQKKIIFIVHGLVIEGLINVRCLSQIKYFEQLLGYYMAHLDKFDIFIIPMANPDGYTFTKVRRNWLKNLSPQSTCYGAYVDRNFDVNWEYSDISTCSQFYPGSAASCEQEVKAVRRVLQLKGQKIAAYINVHAASFGPLIQKGDAILYPHGYTPELIDDANYIDLKEEINAALNNVTFINVDVQMDTLHSWYGQVNGTSVDYASTVYGVPFAMEFLMQPYEYDLRNAGMRAYDLIALREIWGRTIDVVFNFIYSHLTEDPAL